MRVIVVDDDQLVEMSLTTILGSDEEIEVVGSGHDGSEAVTLYQKEKPDVVLMDIQMQEMSGLAAAEEILTMDKAAKILLLTTFSDEEYIVKALGLGVKGYILKQDFEAIIPALKAVYGGQSVFGGEVVSKIPALTAAKHDFPMQIMISEKRSRRSSNRQQWENPTGRSHRVSFCPKEPSEIISARSWKSCPCATVHSLWCFISRKYVRKEERYVLPKRQFLQ